MDKIMLDVKGLAKMIGISESHVRKLVKKGELPHNRLGTKILFNIEKINQYLEEHQINGGN